MAALVLVDAGPLIAYYDAADQWHRRVKAHFETSTSQFVTTTACLSEVLYSLRTDYRVQNELLLDLAKGLYLSENLLPGDFSRIAELNTKYSDLPGDFADLSLIAISERLNITSIISLDSDFDIYRRYGKRNFIRIFP